MCRKVHRVRGRGWSVAAAWLGLHLASASATAVEPAPSFADSIEGTDVVRAMHDRYAGRWYRDLALVQTVRYHSAPPDGRPGGIDSVRVWYESIRLPGVVRSDMAPLDDGNSQLFASGSWHLFTADSLVSARPGLHPVLLLGFDVYVQPIEETLAGIQRFGIDPSPVREDEWEGRPVFVVGSADPDDDARQFWVDSELLLLRRLLWTSSGGVRREVRFDAYEPLGGGWIATELSFLRDGRTEVDERYDFWTIDVMFDPEIFVTEGRARPGWIRN